MKSENLKQCVCENTNAAGGLYDKLSRNPSLLSTSLMANFYNQTSNTFIAALQAIDLNQQSLFVIDTITAGGFNQNDSILQLLMDTLNSELILLQVAIDNSSDTVSINATIESIRQVLWMITSANDSLSKQIEDDRSTQVDSIKADNAALNAITNIANNEKIVNDIYLSTIAKSIYSFNKAQKDALFVIAMQCPMLGGNAVFRARALLALINNEMLFDDRATCNCAGISIRKANKDKHTSTSSIYPNPANQTATLTFHFKEQQTGKLLISNSVGQLIASFSLNGANDRYNFSTEGFTSGIYYCRIVSNEEYSENLKLIIIH